MRALTVELQPHYERVAADNPFPEKLPLLLQHQWETWDAVRDNHLVFNTYPTGTGKTIAALLGILHFRAHNVLIIAPTNALVGQHERDVCDFVRRFQLPHLVKEINADILRNLEVPGTRRKGEKLHQLIRNPAVIDDQVNERSPLMLVTNPDLFYYALFYLFNKQDQRNLARGILQEFDYIIVDELHYYNAKQLANFLYFIVISHHFGYFTSQNRRMVILTATPDSFLQTYIERLEYLGLKCRMIRPEAKPGGSLAADNGKEIQSTARLTLHLLPLEKKADYHGHVEEHLPYLESALGQGQDGVIITSSLRQINQLAMFLQRTPLAGHFARITGPVPAMERAKAAFYPLVLATATVDIGYNFQGHPKERQNIDFGILECSTLDAFWQRLGRIGRVLGKPVRNYPSEAFVYIPAEAWNLLSGTLVETTYTRPELQNLMQETLAPQRLMARLFHGEYISYFSLMEVMLPLQHIHRLLPDDMKEWAQKGFELLKEIYSPRSRRNFWHLFNELKQYDEIRGLLNLMQKNPTRMERRSLFKVLKERYGSDDINLDGVYQLWQDGDADLRQDLEFYLHNKISPYAGMFSFRGHTGDKKVAAYDPEGLLSESRGWVIVDPWHLIKNFTFEVYTRQEIKLFKDLTPPEADIYVLIKNMYEQPLRLKLTYQLPSHLEIEELDSRSGWFVSLRGLKVEAAYQGAVVPLRRQLQDILQDSFVSGVLLQRDFNPAIINRCFREEIYPLELTASKDGSSKQYFFFPGQAGYDFWARYGWSLRKEEHTWIIV
ncbi:type I-D CRISPR-associated helicase Cas3' [Moorella sp. Hama-1]|uniref:type I-D CRISPR-associated helicase Cas3' n=1 Tax=Moorella sp. Hama-1 TaxID=2138101 RepID=UPI000D6477D8|nr:type I-D CRISPR-associated helicase Cas3' [Moorella sp. Hama-1]BCV20513.1 hypothetical protein hamaS1_05820 [Moorella sp. Hama-1]